jgi:hypothetical protein
MPNSTSSVSYAILEHPEENGFGDYLIATLQGVMCFTAMSPDAAVKAAKDFDKKYLELLKQNNAEHLEFIDGYWNGYAIYGRWRNGGYIYYVLGPNGFMKAAAKLSDAYRIAQNLSGCEILSPEGFAEIEEEEREAVVKPVGQP